ncbi:type VI secretion system-associated protein TagF [Xanthobacter oligotrophicus]|uniref:type VI secretion system-associated protein TagF n=1 Tax=Xanthobacter oligotrophicus TaxID=2607286 RepID=UPI001E4C1825|nr:type VI secretion system-associated protein TagF [Xanthobacter oligotrophicus]MCG5233948.1 type VI secretion system-associated protein TagF [Xanthobacter oligotrophicus]
MTCSLYGKLLAKRDFIAENVPRGFLDVFEPWLHGALAASRLELGPDWQKAYFAAPIWRFCLGPGHCGRALLGALMPAIDGVGRSFPLVAFATAPASCAFPRPDDDPQDAWFEALETFLLATLETPVYADVMAAFAGLPEPVSMEATPLGLSPLGGQLAILSGGMAALLPGEGPLGMQDLLLAADTQAGVLYGSWWWTIGGDDFPPAAVCGRQFPTAQTFSAFLTGKLITAA